ncbi:hypothetical protein EIP86_007932 [Pleurotus ostreatoroseus]|nr:hypothetical protein EIP86_007932 [Pleurotus ostreatoroseus]
MFTRDGKIPENTPQRRMAHANGDSAWVYDYDSRLPLPCAAEEYVSGTFPYTAEYNEPYTIPERYVRVVPVRDFLDYFASDRSHMVSACVMRNFQLYERLIRGSVFCLQLVDGCSDAYIRLPPPYAPIHGSRARELQISNNLMSCYVDMKPPGLPETGLASQSLQQHKVTMVEAEIEEDGTADVPSGSARTALVRMVKASEVAQPAPAGVYGQVMDMPGFQAWLGIPRLPSPRG